jgi:hypothetical protein
MIQFRIVAARNYEVIDVTKEECLVNEPTNLEKIWD